MFELLQTFIELRFCTFIISHKKTFPHTLMINSTWSIMQSDKACWKVHIYRSLKCFNVKYTVMLFSLALHKSKLKASTTGFVKYKGIQYLTSVQEHTTRANPTGGGTRCPHLTCRLPGAKPYAAAAAPKDGMQKLLQVGRCPGSEAQRDSLCIPCTPHPGTDRTGKTLKGLGREQQTPERPALSAKHRAELSRVPLGCARSSGMRSLFGLTAPKKEPKDFFPDLLLHWYAYAGDAQSLIIFKTRGEEKTDICYIDLNFYWTELLQALPPSAYCA